MKIKKRDFKVNNGDPFSSLPYREGTHMSLCFATKKVREKRRYHVQFFLYRNAKVDVRMAIARRFGFIRIVFVK